MKVVMTMTVRDEDDILDTNFSYHLAQGVDFFIVTDHDSRDGTRAILDRYAADGRLHLIEERGQEAKWYPQGPWFTRMARLAATEFEADWIINCDADEFWWPAEGSLKDMFGRVSPRYGALSAPIVEYFARPEGPQLFAERMLVRELRSYATYKMAHRATPDVEVSTGSHSVGGTGLMGVPDWPARILHYPVRSVAQLEKRAKLRARSGKDVYRDQYDAYVEGRLEEYYREHALDDEEVARGIEAGYLVADPRLAEWVRTGQIPALDPAPERADIREDMLHALAREQRRVTHVRDRRIARALDRVEKLEARVGKLEGQVDKQAARTAKLSERLKAVEERISNPMKWVRRAVAGGRGVARRTRS